MILKLRLTFRIIFFYSVMYVISATILLLKGFKSMTRRMVAELGVVWSHQEPVQPVE